MGIKYCSVRLQVPEYNVEVWLCSDPMHFRNNEFLDKYPMFSPRWSDFVAICTTNDELYPGQTFLILPFKYDAGLLLHELIHCADNIMKVYGFKGTEFRAYTTQWLFEEITKAVKK